MTDTNTKLDDAVVELEKQLSLQQQEVRNTKIAINSLLKAQKKEPRYTDGEEEQPQGDLRIQADRWFGQPLATAAREYLQMRKLAGIGPASAEEIFEALKQGGYQFEGKDGLQMRGMSISLSKYTEAFQRLPNGKIGLKEWYPAIKDKKKRTKEAGAESDESAAGATKAGESANADDQAPTEVKSVLNAK